MVALSKKDQEFYATLAARAEAEAYVPIAQLNTPGVATSTTAEELDALIGELDDDDDEPIASAN